MGIDHSHSEKVYFCCDPKFPGSRYLALLCLVFCILASQGEPLLSQRLEGWLSGNTGEHLSNALRSDVPCVAMPDGWKVTFVAAEGMHG